jgi:DNA-binding response OmpR family regulator
MHILLVEDEPHVGRALERSMTAWGHEVVAVGTGAAALAAIAAAPVDVIVLDVNLPDLSGWDVLRRLDPGARDAIPVIVISAIAPSVSRQHEFRPFGVLHKPFPLESLHRLVSLAESWPGRAVPEERGITHG